MAGSSHSMAAALSPQDQAIYKHAFELADQDQWPTAMREADTARNPILRDVLLWQYMKQSDSGYGFDSIRGFLTTHPGWPGESTLRRRAEDSLTGTEPDQKQISWFSAHPPVTGRGKMLYAQALLARGDAAQAHKIARDAWLNEIFSADDEQTFLKQFGSLFSEKDHEQRLDTLLWNGHMVSATRMYGRVDQGHEILAKARIALQTMHSSANSTLRQVPKELISTPGLIYDRMVWRLKKDLDESAVHLVKAKGKDTTHADRWWWARARFARWDLEQGYISDAYKMVAQHGMTSGSSYAEAEWMAGWIALRFLNEPKTALRHFRHMREAVSTPISVGRATYWSGRAEEAMGNKAQATQSYQEAAAQLTTFYGQLAALHLNSAQRPALPQTPVVTPADKTAFLSNSLVNIVRALSEIDHDDMARPFLYRLTEDAATDGQRVLAVRLGAEIGRPDLSVSMSRRAAMQGVHVIEWAYPTPQDAMPPDPVPEIPLVLSVIRQESSFRPTAISHAGARGLMQLMPSTARHLAKKWKISHTTDQLTTDPAHNIRLGSGYLEEMIERFNGSYIMAVAGYNAGPGRPARWAREFGDPRKSVNDAIDWIEMIPFNETRNYVMRVMESVAVYRTRLSGKPFRYSLADDLVR